MCLILRTNLRTIPGTICIQMVLIFDYPSDTNYTRLSIHFRKNLWKIKLQTTLLCRKLKTESHVKTALAFPRSYFIYFIPSSYYKGVVDGRASSDAACHAGVPV
jgi:hypothetical protein